MESRCYDLPSTFFTLTYNDANLPENGTLSREDWRAFTHRIGFRYFGCGEYGDRTSRPHYHGIAFGVPPRIADRILSQRWTHGFRSTSEANAKRFAYVAGYITKRLNKETDERLDEDQIPEFSRMSRRPGIGIPYLDKYMVNWYFTKQGCDYLSRFKDVHKTIRIDGVVYPLGKTCVNYLRREVGLSETMAPNVKEDYLAQASFEAKDAQIVALKNNKRVKEYDHVKLYHSRNKGTM